MVNSSHFQEDCRDKSATPDLMVYTRVFKQNFQPLDSHLEGTPHFRTHTHNIHDSFLKSLLLMVKSTFWLVFLPGSSHPLSPIITHLKDCNILPTDDLHTGNLGT